MKAQINLTDKSEAGLLTIKKIGLINNVDVSTKEKQINLAIEISAKCVEEADEKTIVYLTGLKKTI